MNLFKFRDGGSYFVDIVVCAGKKSYAGSFTVLRKDNEITVSGKNEKFFIVDKELAEKFRKFSVIEFCADLEKIIFQDPEKIKTISSSITDYDVIIKYYLNTIIDKGARNNLYFKFILDLIFSQYAVN